MSTTQNNKDAPLLKPPTTYWAQRANLIYLTIALEDCKKPTIKLEKDKLYFSGKSESLQQDADHADHEVTIEFNQPINTEESKYVTRDRGTEFIIVKESNGWWPRLLKSSAKQHWLKIDFTKWKDEDDSDDEAPNFGGAPGQPDFGDLMRQMGGMNNMEGLEGMGGMAGLGGMGGLGGMDGDKDEEDDDSEGDELPPELE